MFHGATVAEGFEQMFFGFSAGEQIGTVALDLQTGELRPATPYFATGFGQLEHWARRLAGDQGLAEVAHRGAQRRGGAFEDGDLETAFGGGVGVGQA
ncbi:hypothetical protein D3C81_1959900 [compost metagenome]